MLKIQNLQTSLNKKQILKNINFELLEGETLCIIGKNGSGKSTLLRTLTGLLDYQGNIKIKHQELKTIQNKSKLIAYVPQDYKVSFNFSLLEVVLMGSYMRQKQIFYSKEDQLKAYDILERLGLSHLSNQLFCHLSGGQKQLGLIARALLQESQILILDEPVSALDISYYFDFLDWLYSLNKTIIFTSHHIEHCFIANKILMLKNGEVFDFGKMKELLVEEKINALYDKKFICTLLPNGGRYFCKKPNDF